MDGSVFEEKSSFKMLGLSFSSKLDWGSYVISIAKTSKIKETMIHSVKFLSLEVALYFHKSIIQSCLEYCCHIRTGAPTCYLDMLDKLQKLICRTAGPSLIACLEPLAYHWNTTSLSLSDKYYFGRCSSELAELVPICHSQGRSNHSNSCTIFLSPFLQFIAMFMFLSSHIITQLDSGSLCPQIAFLLHMI